MKFNQLYSKFLELSKEEIQEKYFKATHISDSFEHKLACSYDGYPVFMLKTKDDTITNDISLNLMSVVFNRLCNIKTEDNDCVQYRYTIIQLKSRDVDIQKYFLEVVYMVLCKINPIPTTQTIRSEINKIIKLFTNTDSLSKETIRGLWAELLLIEKSKNPLYLLNSWHVTPNDKYDFNDGKDKIEVKSTTKDKREHVFSLEQLYTNDNSKLLIASVFVTQSGIGKNIFDLFDSISKRISDTSAIIKLKEVILSTIGTHIKEVEQIYFDYDNSQNTLAFYDSKDVPKIEISNIPIHVYNVKFCSDLSLVPKVESDYLKDSFLFSQLI